MDEPDYCPDDFYDEYDFLDGEDATKVEGPRTRPANIVMTQKGPIRLYGTGEMLKLPAPSWLIRDIIPLGGFAALYAEPESFKSFLAADMCLSVAAGGYWQGHDCGTGTFSLYVSGEGGGGMSKRIEAWLKHRGLKPHDAQMAWLLEPIYVHSESTGIERLLERIEQEVGRIPKFVVIDTLARCFEGDENQQEDMNRFVAGVDLLRKEWGCTVLAIHHTRLDGERERGSTNFRGALDTMIKVEKLGRVHEHGKPKTVKLSCTKQKDAEHFEDFKVRLITVPLGEDAEGEPVDSLTVDTAVIPSGREGGRTPKTDYTKKGLTPACDALLQRLTIGPMTAKELITETGLPKATVYHYLKLLKKEEFIIEETGGVWAAV